MKLKYLRMVRRTYRYLRHPRIRKIKWLTPFTKELFYKQYWRPCRSTVANGLSIGLFCAMLPIPMQMLIAALGCIRAKGNIPIALAACWVSNPVSQLPIWILQEKFGSWVREYIHISSIPPKVSQFTILGVEITGSVENFIIGFLSSAILLGIIAYPLVWGVSMFLPNRGRSIHQ